jgi:hypothetical protein
MELVEFYATNHRDDLPGEDAVVVRYQAVAAVMRALTLPAYHVTEALDLIQRLQPPPARGRKRKGSG